MATKKVPAELPPIDADADVRRAFQMALLQQLQSGECSAAWGDVARRYLADVEQQRQWELSRADLEIQADKPTQVERQLDLKRLPFPVE
jgi:hypothetical protein